MLLSLKAATTVVSDTFTSLVRNAAALLGLSSIGLVWVLALHSLGMEHRQAVAVAYQDAENLSRAFEEHIVRSINAVDQTLMYMRDSYQNDPVGFDLAGWSRRTQAMTGMTFQIGIIDAAGELLVSTAVPSSTRINLSDREHFQFHRDNSTDQLFISKPVLGRASQQWSIQLTRRLALPNGQFGGVIVVSLDPQYLSHFLGAVDVGANGTITVVGQDGVVRAQSGAQDLERRAQAPNHPDLEVPKPNPRIGTSISKGHLMQASTAKPAGSFTAVSSRDAVSRINAYRVIRDYPLIVEVGLAEEDVLAPYWAKRKSYIALATGLSVVLSGVIFLVILRQTRLNRALDELQANKQILDTTLDNISQGIIMVDAAGQVQVCNRRAIETLGLPEAMMASRPCFADVVRFQQGISEFGKDFDEVNDVVRNLVLAGNISPVLHRYERRRPDGTVLSINTIPLCNGGAVSTYTDVTEVHRAKRHLSHMAHHDELTGLPNRVYFRQRLDLALTEQNSRDDAFALLYLDLDHFKSVNDTLGHQAGDQLLREVSERLKACVRGHDVVARISGDEFAILQMGSTDRTAGAALAQRIIVQLGTLFQLGGGVVNIGASVGIAMAPSDGSNADTLMKSADLALYRAKAEGRGICRFFDAEMDFVLRENHEIEVELRKALGCGEMAMHYQPQVDLATGRITGCEALMRWNSGKLGPIPPSKFIPLAEKIGIIGDLGDWALHEACRAATRWPGDIRVAVNLSPAQLKFDDVLGLVADTLKMFALPAHRLELEITETVLLQDSASLMATLHGLHDLGVRISLDDFGTGYSSPSYLVRFPFDKVKIDRSFVSGADTNPRSMAIVRSITALAMELGITTTAEGVETEEQREQMRLAHCTDIQGYLISQPVPEAAITAMLLAEMHALDTHRYEMARESLDES